MKILNNFSKKLLEKQKGFVKKSNKIEFFDTINDPKKFQGLIVFEKN